MRLDKLTIKAQEALFEANNIASQFSHQQVEPEHLLAALLRQESGITPDILRQVGANPDSIDKMIQTDLENRSKVYGPGAQAGRLPYHRKPTKCWKPHGRKQRGCRMSLCRPSTS